MVNELDIVGFHTHEQLFKSHEQLFAENGAIF